MSKSFKFHVQAQVTVDEEDAELVQRYQCYYNEGYVRCVVGDRLEYLHRLIAGAKVGEVVDHINRNPLDNRRANLRIASRTENILNAPRQRVKIGTENSRPQSPYKGAHWQPMSQKWSSSFRGKYLGLFETDREAAEAYDKAVRASGVEGAFLNFPDGVVSGPVLRIPRTKRGIAGSSSKFAGVSWNSQNKKWSANIKRGDKKLHLGFYEDEEFAAGMYDAVARALDGEMAKVNFTDREFEMPPKLAMRLKSKGVLA